MNEHEPRRIGQRSRIVRLCQKELRETVRDRRTIMTLFLMPLLLYPLLSMALNRFLLSSGASASNEYTIGVETQREGELLRAYLDDPQSKPPIPILKSSGGELAEFKILLTEPITAVDALKQNSIDVAANVEFLPTPKVIFTAYRGDATSLAARRVLVERMQWLKSQYAQKVAEALSNDYRAPIQVAVNDAGAVKEVPLLATIVPLVLVLMTITGAVYPAIDLTAGERERGTMESLMASPVPRFYVLFAKYVAVVIVALLTAMINLLAMFTTLWASGMLPMLTGGESFPWITVLQILGLLILFSGFFSAVLLSLTSFAKSFKEAQAYLIPVMLLAITPGMLSLMPGVSLSGALAIAPLISIVLLARDLLSGSFEPAAALAAVLSTIAYAFAALAIASRLFGSDAVTRTSEQSIATLFHRPKRSRPIPSIQAATLMLALLVPIYFIASNGLMRFLTQFRDNLSMSSQFWLNALTLFLTFGCVPWFACYLGRNNFRLTFRLHRPTVVTLIGAILMGLGAWAIAHESFVIAQSLGIGGLSEKRIEETLGQLENWKKVSPFVLLATFAVAPAIIEELCFRGFLFSSLSKVMSPGRVIVITAVIFGLFHVLTGNALLIERFVPTTLLGLILGWVAYRSGSVIPGMVMHFVHNGLLELVGYYHDTFDFFGSELDDQAHLPLLWLAATAGMLIVGAAIVWMGSSSVRNEVEKDS